MIKKYTTILLAIVAALCLMVLAGNHHNTYKDSQMAEDEAVAAAIEKFHKQQMADVSNKLALQQAETARVSEECQKGEIAYENLTEFQKTEIPAPVCSEQEAEQKLDEAIEAEESEVPTSS